MSALEDRIRSEDDAVLLKMLTVDAGNYRDDALEMARAELGRRGVAIPESEAAYAASLGPEELLESDLFCRDCLDESVGKAFPVTGESMMRVLKRKGYDKCDTCGSVVRDHCVVAFGVPLWIVDRYRIKQVEVPWPGRPNIIASRRIDEPASEERRRRAVEASRRGRNARKRARRRR